jgi:hypothetical protein
MKKLRLTEKPAMKALNAPLGDFRDCAAIEAWAGSVAEALQG